MDDLTIPKPLRADWFLILVNFQADLIYNTLLVLTSPLFLIYQSYRRAAATVTAAEKVVKRVPARVTGGLAVVVRRSWFGILGACQVSMLMVVAMMVASVVGVGIVNLYVEKPVVVRERLFFDYTEDNPSAVFSFDQRKRVFGVPVGHKVHVGLVLWMPESDHNRKIGPFQLKVELLSSKGETIAKSSQPCMLRFRSKPIRLARTFVMSVPLVAGIANEAQTMKIDALKHEEKWPRTRAVRATLLPRAQTWLLPQLYEAEVVLTSKPPWIKRMAYNWKWTLCVWTSFYLYVVVLVLLLWCCRPLVFPYRTTVESLSCLSRQSNPSLSHGSLEIELDEETSNEKVREEAIERKWKERRHKPRRVVQTT